MAKSEAPGAIVTGASRGIGRATAVALARAGFDVAITARTVHEGDARKLPEAKAFDEPDRFTGSLDSTAEAIQAEGRRALPLVLDLLDRDVIASVAEQAVAALGRVDVLVNNAIYVSPGGHTAFLDEPADEIVNRLFGNVTAQLLFTRPVLRHMVDRGHGVVATVTSGAGYFPPPGPPGEGGWALTYGVSKAGVNRFAEQLVAEHGRDGIRAYSLQPGAVATERVLAAGRSLEFVARHAAPVEVVGEAIARILTAPPGTWPNGSVIEVQDEARSWGLLPGPTDARPDPPTT